MLTDAFQAPVRPFRCALAPPVAARLKRLPGADWLENWRDEKVYQYT